MDKKLTPSQLQIVLDKFEKVNSTAQLHADAKAELTEVFKLIDSFLDTNIATGENTVDREGNIT
jgi:hypothetical protein